MLALTKCGRLFAWGNNEYGQIWPVTDEVQVLEPVELPLRDSITILDKNHAVGFKLGAISRIASAGSMCGVLDEHGHVRTFKLLRLFSFSFVKQYTLF